MNRDYRPLSPMRFYRWVGILSLSILAACSANTGNNKNLRDSKTGSSKVVSAEGDFSLLDTDGKRVHLSDFSGKVLLVSFWATWCEPCQLELPQLQKLWKKYRGQGFELLTICADGADTQSEVKRLIRRYRYDFPVLLDQSGEVTDKFNPSMELPFSMLMDTNGKIISRHQGYRPGDEKQIEQEIGQLLHD